MNRKKIQGVRDSKLILIFIDLVKASESVDRTALSLVDISYC